MATKGQQMKQLKAVTNQNTPQVGKKQAGHLLDGVEYRQMPEVNQ